MTQFLTSSWLNSTVMDVSLLFLPTFSAEILSPLLYFHKLREKIFAQGCGRICYTTVCPNILSYSVYETELSFWIVLLKCCGTMHDMNFSPTFILSPVHFNSEITDNYRIGFEMLVENCMSFIGIHSGGLCRWNWTGNHLGCFKLFHLESLWFRWSFS